MADSKQILDQVVPSFMFRVNIGFEGFGYDSYSFSKVTGLSVDHGEILYRAGNEGKAYRKMGGIAQFSPVICDRGYYIPDGESHGNIDGFAGQALNYEVLTGTFGFSALEFRIPWATIEILGGASGGDVVQKYILKKPYIRKWELGEFDANRNATLIETISLTHEGIFSQFLSGVPINEIPW